MRVNFCFTLRLTRGQLLPQLCFARGPGAFLQAEDLSLTMGLRHERGSRNGRQSLIS